MLFTKQKKKTRPLQKSVLKPSDLLQSRHISVVVGPKCGSCKHGGGGEKKAIIPVKLNSSILQTSKFT